MLRKALSADKEVQTSIVNFRKDGSAFINLVSVIFVAGGVSGGKHELNDIVYHVGFQVYLTEQPNVILERLRVGTYQQHEQDQHPSGPAAIFPSPAHTEAPLTHRKVYTVPQVTMSPTLTSLLDSQTFLDSLPVSTSTTAPLPLTILTNSPLSLLLLEYAPDFIHVVSLKGAFLYVAPAVTRVLSYAPGELVGKATHPEDVVPLERQLKESSTLLPSCPGDGEDAVNQIQAQAQARTIDVLFRARTKGAWTGTGPGAGGREREFWAQVAGRGYLAGALVGFGAGVEDVLGYTPEELVGRRIGTLVVGWKDKEGKRDDEDEDEDEGEKAKTTTTTVWGRLMTKAGGAVRVSMVFYRSGTGALDPQLKVAPAHVLVQIRLLDDEFTLGGGESFTSPLSISISPINPSPAMHAPDANIFADFEVSRGSSWQYELQQLRFANRRLREEVEVLEAEVAEQDKDKEKLPVVQSDAQEPASSSSLSLAEATAAAAVVIPAPTLSSSSSAPAPVPMGFADIASAGMGTGDVYPEMALGMGMSTGTGTGMGVGVGMSMSMGGGGEHTNYSVALERYAARAEEAVRGFGAVGAEGRALMPPTPLTRPTIHAQHAQAHAHVRSQRRPSVSLHQQQQQHQQQQGVYAPVPLPLGRSALMQGMGQHQHQHASQLARAPSRMDGQPSRRSFTFRRRFRRSCCSRATEFSQYPTELDRVLLLL
ncbi:putative PAS domain containing protein [Lyophyllum shimeji]|uniref:PAS domain containing protein n=1 Tax=Lyophyllum shimeji TaxID=47721 RepID=A0A9P3US31_LYOSH|nr:putative PAS domain containing protein [Lyophyllum shimeji]